MAELIGADTDSEKAIRWLAAVPRTCAMSSFKAVLSISISRLARATTTVAPKIA